MDNQRVPVPLGLVSQVAVDPPLLNWIYVDKDTMEVKYGNKTASVSSQRWPRGTGPRTRRLSSLKKVQSSQR